MGGGGNTSFFRLSFDDLHLIFFFYTILSFLRLPLHSELLLHRDSTSQSNYDIYGGHQMEGLL